MKMMLLLALTMLLQCGEPASLTIKTLDETFELTDKECIMAIVNMTKSKEAYKDPGLPPIGEGGDTKIIFGKRVVCEVNIGLQYYSVGKKKFSIPENLFKNVKLAIEGPRDSWQLSRKWGENNDTKQRDIETRDMAVQKRIAAVLKPYLGGNEKRIDEYPLGNGVRYVFGQGGGEIIEYDVQGKFIYNMKRMFRLNDADNTAFVDFIKTIDPKFSIEK